MPRKIPDDPIEAATLKKMIADQQRERYRSDPEFREKKKQAVLRWQAKHPDAHAAQKALAKERFRANPENLAKARAAEKKYRLANPEKVHAMQRRHYRSQKATYPWKMLLWRAKERAQAKRMPFELTREWAQSVWTGKCAVTGIPFEITFPGKPTPLFLSPSIDRIENGTGYTPANCRFVLMAINAFKGDMTDADMIRVARAIVENNPLNADT